MPVITKFPSANEVENTGWTTPNNAHADDATYTTAAPAKNGLIGTRWKTFGFDSLIPAGASITKVQIIYEYKTSTTLSIATMRVRARIDGVDEENHDNTAEPAADTIVTVDITADRTWTRANLLDASLMITGEARRGNDNDAVTFSLDYIKVEVTYSITSDKGTFTLTGNAASTLANRKITSDLGTFTFTGNAAGLAKGYPLVAGVGSFTLTGIAASLLANRKLTSEQGSFVHTGIAATFGIGMPGATGTFVFTGNDATLILNSGGYTLTAEKGTFTLTGNAASLLIARLLAASVGAFALTGNAASLFANRLIGAAVGSFVFTGNDASLIHSYPLTANVGSFVLTGNATSLLANRKIAADVQSYILTGNAASLYRTFPFPAATGSFVLTGNAATLLHHKALAAAVGSYTISGEALLVYFMLRKLAVHSSLSGAEPVRTDTQETLVTR